MMSNTKNIRNIFLAVAALVLTGAIFTGCGRNEKTGNECGKTEVFADDLQKGNAAFETKDYETAVKCFSSAAEQGSAEAQYQLGHCFALGKGVKASREKAVKWWRKAAEQDHAKAQLMLADCYEYGTGVKLDQKQATNWLRKAAEQGDAEAQNKLGVRYHTGIGVSRRDDKQAAFWIHKAAAQGHAAAQYNLGVCYELGKGIKKNMKMAVELYRKAAAQGEDRAMQALEGLGEKE